MSNASGERCQCGHEKDRHQSAIGCTAISDDWVCDCVAFVPAAPQGAKETCCACNCERDDAIHHDTRMRYMHPFGLPRVAYEALVETVLRGDNPPGETYDAYWSIRRSRGAPPASECATCGFPPSHPYHGDHSITLGMDEEHRKSFIAEMHRFVPAAPQGAKVEPDEIVLPCGCRRKLCERHLDAHITASENAHFGLGEDE